MMETKENRPSQEVAAQSMKRMLGKIAGLIFEIILAISSKGTILEILMCGIAMMGIASLCIEAYCFASRLLGRRFYDEDGNCYQGQINAHVFNFSCHIKNLLVDHS